MDPMKHIKQAARKLDVKPTPPKPKPSLQNTVLVDAPGYSIFNDPTRATVKTHAGPENCQRCGFPPGVPGQLKDPSAHNGLAPCSVCYDKNMAKRQTLNGQLEGVLRGWTFDNFVPLEGSVEAYRAVTGWVPNPVGWCTLWGDFGPGKTHLAASVANHLGKDMAVYFNFPDLTSLLRSDPGRAGELIRKIERVPVLILDELSAVSLRMWTSEQVQRLISYRVRNEDNYGLMICSNTAPDDYGQELAYVGSRMKSEGWPCVQMTGDNRSIRNKLARLAEEEGNHFSDNL